MHEPAAGRGFLLPVRVARTDRRGPAGDLFGLRVGRRPCTPAARASRRGPRASFPIREVGRQAKATGVRAEVASWGGAAAGGG